MKAQMANSDHTRCQRRSKIMPKSSEFSRRQFAASALATAALAALPAISRADAKMKQIKGDEMMNLTLYLLFDGNCHQAMEFYKSCFGGELTSTKVKDSPAKDFMPAVQQEKTVNARLKSGNVEISASDWLRLDQTRIRGNTVCLYLTMAQRISRAKQSIKVSGAPFCMLPLEERAERLPAVLHVLYLIFNKGYASSIGSHLQR